MIERLTERDEYGNADIIGVDSAELQLNLEFDELNRVTDALNRLASYEDSGLSPEEVILLKKKKKKTNADKIRSMTDEELANLLSTAWNKADYEDDDYDPAWLKWLRMPEEQEGLR